MRSSSQFGVAILVGLLHAPVVPATQGELANTVVQISNKADSASYAGVVEPVRQTVISSQVAGAIVMLSAKVGDVVKEGQLLARIDARSASQESVASQAQVRAARSALDLATKDYERKRHLYEKQYISQSAMENAEARFHATSAQLNAQIAQAGIAHIQSDFFTIKAPYAGIISEVPVEQGDMALPGKPLLTLYDPFELRVTASVPQTVLTGYVANQSVKVELPGMDADHQWLLRPHMQILPTADASTHSAHVRIDLPVGMKGITPGTYARVWLPIQSGTSSHLFIPVAAVVRRAEMTGVYVLDANKRPLLRQVHLGKTQNDMIEVLAGISAGEHVVTNPQAAVKDIR